MSDVFDLIKEANDWIESSTGYEPNDDLIERLLIELKQRLTHEERKEHVLSYDFTPSGGER